MLSLLKLKPAVYIIGAMLIFIAGYKVCAWRHDSQQVKAIKKAQESTQVHVDNNYKQELVTAKKQQEYQKTTKEQDKNVTREITAVPVYSECVVPADGVRLINDAVNTANQAKAAC